MISMAVAKTALGGFRGFLKKVPWQVWAGIAAFLFVLWLRSHWIGVGEDRLKPALAKFQEAQKTNMATIATLTEANKQWAAVADTKNAKAVKAEQELRNWQAANDQKPAKAKQEREKIYDRNPDARAWANTRLPPSVSSSLRK